MRDIKALEAGWIEWAGGECPVLPDTEVWIKYRVRDGTVEARDTPDRAAWFDHLDWWRGTANVQIVAYRVAAPLPEQEPRPELNKEDL